MTFGASKFTGFLGAATAVIGAEYLLILSDVILAGRVLGETALGAFALLMPFFAAISFLVGTLGVGTASVCTEALGRLDRDQANHAAGQGLIAAVGLGILLAIGVAVLLEPLLFFMAPGEEIASLARAFGRWLPLVAAFAAVDMYLLLLVQAYGGERDCIVSAVGQLMVNVALSYGLCEGLWGLPCLGMAGIAIGTAAAFAFGIILLLPALLRHRRGLKFIFRWDADLFRAILMSSCGEMSAGLFHALTFVIVARFLIVYYGAESLPIATIVFCIIRLTVCFRGVGAALRPLEPFYYGEKNVLAVKQLVRLATFVAVAESVLLTGIVLLAPELIVALFGIEDAELFASTVRAIRLTVVGLLGYAITHLVTVHYSHIGLRKRAIALMVFAFFAMPSALLFGFGAIYGMDGIFLAVAVGPLVPLATFLLFFRRRRIESSSLMWSIPLNSSEKIALVIVSARESLKGRCSETSLRRLTDVLMLALKRLKERNGERCRVEVSLLFGQENVELILRDDGAHEALDDLGLPVVHVPAGHFNRNVFSQPIGGPSRSLAKRKTGGKYIVLRGQDVPPEDVEAIIALDRQSFAEAYQVAPEQDIELFKANRENGLVIKDAKTGEVVAYSMLLPVREEIYDRILSGRFIDTALTPDMVLSFDNPGTYRMYFASIVIHPAHRGASLFLTMFDAMVSDFVSLAERGVFGLSLAADAVSEDGEKLAKLFGLTEVRKTNHASTIYEVRGLPPEFRVTTPITERLVGLYWEKFVQEKLKQ